MGKNYLNFSRRVGIKPAFTLAEVLITLGIIGVVAAMTIPALISKYQKHVYYTQFMKAVTVLENAINQYNLDNNCGEKVPGWFTPSAPNYIHHNNLCVHDEGFDFVADKLSKYMNVVQWITDDNYEEVCEGYKKLPPASNYDGTERYSETWYGYCINDIGAQYNKGYAFITNDGMLFNFALDLQFGAGFIVDTNGTKGPNIEGRDMFTFYLHRSPSVRWGYPKEIFEGCFDDNKWGDNCGIRLLQEGKMNY